MSTSSTTSSLEQLQLVFPNVILVDTGDLARALGIAVKTINNAGDDFPIRPIRFGRRKYFRVIDIASFMDAALGIALPPPAPALPAPASPVPVSPKRGRGRPPKGRVA